MQFYQYWLRFYPYRLIPERENQDEPAPRDDTTRLLYIKLIFLLGTFSIIKYGKIFLAFFGPLPPSLA